MEIKVIYGETTKKEKVISLQAVKNKETLCTLINASVISKLRKRQRDKFLIDLQESINSIVNVFKL